MKKIKKIALTLVGAFFIATLFSFISNINKKEYKCVIQLTNYTGEGAYVVVSLINSKGKYEETLYVLGEDEKWYDYFKQWWSFWEKDKVNIDAITGESIIGGDRKIVKLKLDPAKINTGYKIRFETAVEDQEYHVKDVEVDFSPESLKGKIEGTGYIRYVRFLMPK